MGLLIAECNQNGLFLIAPSNRSTARDACEKNRHFFLQTRLDCCVQSDLANFDCTVQSIPHTGLLIAECNQNGRFLIALCNRLPRSDCEISRVRLPAWRLPPNKN
jgi:hypothetical protein